MIGQVAGKIKVVRIRNEADLAQLQQRALLISTTYESEGILARIADHHHLFPRIEPCQATLEDAFVYCMGGETDA